MPKSTKFSLLPLAVAVTSLMLSACGGGSFNNPSTIVIGQSKMIEKSDQSKDASAAKDDDNANADTKNKADSRLTMPVLGSVLAIPKRNQAYDKKKLTHLEEHVPLDENNITTAHTNPLPALTKELQERYEGGKIYQSDDKYKFVKAGWIFTGLRPDETIKTDEDTDQPKQYTKGDGYLYYYGDNPTTGLAKGVANYTGHWDFVTDVKRERESTITETTGRQAFGGGSGYKMDSGFGDEVGATSFAEQVFGQYAPRQGNHRAVFKADFDAKKLTGTLSTKQKAIASSPETYVDRYDIDATIKGNRFAGSAIAKNTKSSFLEPNFFNKNADNRLEGGFYGENAEELAGKFLTNDNSVFAVFAGKQDNPEKVEKLEQVFGGSYVELTQDKAVNPAQKSQVLSLVNFGNVDQLQLGDHTITLLPQEAGKTTQQSVKLPTGQTAVITSFGSSDGVLRLGSVSKTAKAIETTAKSKPAENVKVTNKDKAGKPAKPTAEQLEAAKQKLTEKVEGLKKELSDLIATYPTSKDKSALRKQITEKALAGYADAKEKAYAMDDLKELLNSLDVKDERADATENILNILVTGDKYKTENQENLKEFLVQIPSKQVSSSPTEEQIAKIVANPTAEQLEAAKQKLTEKVEGLKKELSDLIATYPTSKDKSALRKQITEKALAGYADAKEKAYAMDDLKELLNSLDVKDERADATENILNILVTGDKYKTENQENLKEFLVQNLVAQSTPSHTQDQITKAKADLKAKLETEKQELKDLLDSFAIENGNFGGDEESGETAQNRTEDEGAENVASSTDGMADAGDLEELKTQVVDKIKSAYSKDKQDAIGKQAEKLFDDFSNKLKAGDEDAGSQLLVLFAKGDNYDGENMANLTAYLPALPSTPDASTPEQSDVIPLIGIEDSLTGLYILGQRTPVSQIANQGQANYQGTWHGRIGHHWQSQAGYGEYDGKAKFEVDFGTKQLTGTLTEKSGIEPAFNLKATINGNGFSGTATSRSNGIYLDEGRQQNQQILTVESNNLTGAFYGENAKHLGGSFSFEKTLNDDETVVGGAVFYGTRTKE
ncbi:transferrin-binding protein-like solute binding protein [Moraxella bovis]|uniref:Transferrin-binding protein B n=2 Tax=Moraxella bovis TaxID=476 RepID=A0A378PWP2_MORBO|nr:transferrin-binding protein-like solute binding protein [Moraxella bovis]STY92870.1 Transferrin-binding protein 2 precursor [Moraxella bovis]